MTLNYGQGTPERPSQGWKLFITATVMVILAGFFVAGRLAVRIRSKMLGTDDYLICCSLFCSIILTLCINLAVVNGYGMHKKQLSPQQLIAAMKWFYGAQIIYKVLLGFNKSSLLCLYMRIFPVKKFIWSCYITLGIVITWSAASVISTIFQCNPVAGFWDSKIPGMKCYNTDAFWYAYAIINIITDVAVLLLPLQQVRKLHLPVMERVGVGAIFAIGIFVCATSIIRTNAVAISMQNKADSTWTFIPRSTWTLAEANVGIICACLPCLPMLRRPFMFLFPCFSKLRSRNTASKPGYNVYSVSSGQNSKHVELDNMNKSPWEIAAKARKGNESEEAIIGLEHAGT
ncbi:hypothetical protein V8E51_007264 [Hyaloscypha variabilis]|uniref:Rhodopsin domain-containing protein n=1 Tax=Hyaloscypha variabilis (strain UAMH 11265 / GT02V1 / F) TaxID=1149755 RepID=A0A2J6R1V8_HYAVF|nr:hypothetical protein L207DRAFT_440755 [Hyaloscypha variabilis F]